MEYATREPKSRITNASPSRSAVAVVETFTVRATSASMAPVFAGMMRGAERNASITRSALGVSSVLIVSKASVCRIAVRTGQRRAHFVVGCMLGRYSPSGCYASPAHAMRNAQLVFARVGDVAHPRRSSTATDRSVLRVLAHHNALARSASDKCASADSLTTTSNAVSSLIWQDVPRRGSAGRQCVGKVDVPNTSYLNDCPPFITIP